MTLKRGGKKKFENIMKNKTLLEGPQKLKKRSSVKKSFYNII